MMWPNFLQKKHFLGLLFLVGLDLVESACESILVPSSSVLSKIINCDAALVSSRPVVRTTLAGNANSDRMPRNSLRSFSNSETMCPAAYN